jgi:hypothetical protein
MTVVMRRSTEPKHSYVVEITHDVVHAIPPNAGMHLLVAIYLIGHGPEEAAAIFDHLGD